MLEIIILLFVGYGVASATVPDNEVEITSVKICNQHDIECKKGWVRK